MTKVAVIMANGFEEGETLTIVDILRRAKIECDLVGFEKEVKGAHDIVVRSDIIFSKNVQDLYDMIVLPGGYGGVEYMCQSQTLFEVLTNMLNDEKKFVCAMCAAPLVLFKAGLLKDKKYTAYIGYDKKITDGQYVDEIVVRDGNLITSKAPGTTYAFAYSLVDALGYDSLSVKKRMAYFEAYDVKEDDLYV